MRKLSIVVPSYNERGNVEMLVEQIDRALDGIDHEIIFVDDSTDDTPEIIDRISVNKNHVRVKHRTGEKGLSSAVIEGFEMAAGDYMAVMDADLQHPPEILRYMYYCLETGVDFCVPSRFIPGGSDGGLKIHRKFVSGVARYIGKILAPSLRKISDPTSGLFMFRREVIENADLQPIGWKILIEVLAMGTYQTVVEIPYKFQNRLAGDSKLSFDVTIEYLKQVIGLMKRGKRQRGVKVIRWSVEQMKAAENK